MTILWRRMDIFAADPRPVADMTPRQAVIFRRLLGEADALGFRVELVGFVESPEYPGPMLGMWGGVCDSRRKVIRLRTWDVTPYRLILHLKHELAHARGEKVVTGLGVCGGTWAPLDGGA